jgi:hypothetical protein
MMTWEAREFPTHKDVSIIRVLGFHSGVIKNSDLLGCGAASLGELFLMFWRNIVPYCQRFRSMKNGPRPLQKTARSLGTSETIHPTTHSHISKTEILVNITCETDFCRFKFIDWFINFIMFHWIQYRFNNQRIWNTSYIYQYTYEYKITVII